MVNINKNKTRSIYRIIFRNYTWGIIVLSIFLALQSKTPLKFIYK